MAAHKLKLTIELVPASAWYQNLRKILPKAQWDALRKSVYKKYNHQCGICRSGGELHCHEVWEYDDGKKVQKLKGVIALCQSCHAIKHIGLSGIKASQGELDFEKLVRHFMKVNGCDRKVFEEHRDQAFKIWEERSKYEWTLDLNP